MRARANVGSSASAEGAVQRTAGSIDDYLVLACNDSLVGRDVLVRFRGALRPLTSLAH